MRVENIFDAILGEETARVFGKARWVGPYIHMPLIVAGFVLALFTRTLGFTWLALMVVVAELLIVISRFVFSYEQALMGDLVRYWYAALFLFASAYTLFEEGHVRVDVLYAGFASHDPRLRQRHRRHRPGHEHLLGDHRHGHVNGARSIINSAGCELRGLADRLRRHVHQIPDGRAFLGLFAITMLIQFVSYFFDAVAGQAGMSPATAMSPPAAH